MINPQELKVLIPSESVRNFMAETGWTITEWDAALILYHQDRPESAVREAFYALRDGTKDAVLKGQLSEYLEREERAAMLSPADLQSDISSILQQPSATLPGGKPRSPLKSTLS